MTASTFCAKVASPANSPPPPPPQNPEAFRALKAITAAGRDKEGILVIGIDGENRAIRAVVAGELTATFTYSTVAPEGVIAAYALAKGDCVGSRGRGKTRLSAFAIGQVGTQRSDHRHRATRSVAELDIK